jgi:hypothetical protein
MAGKGLRSTCQWLAHDLYAPDQARVDDPHILVVESGRCSSPQSLDARPPAAALTESAPAPNSTAVRGAYLRKDVGVELVGLWHYHGLDEILWRRTQTPCAVHEMR